MDVVNGKIVSARTERSRCDIWSALKPSRGVLLQEPNPRGAHGMGRPDYGGPPGRFSSLRGFGPGFGEYNYGYPVPGPEAAAQNAQPGWKRNWPHSWDDKHCETYHQRSCTAATPPPPPLPPPPPPPSDSTSVRALLFDEEMAMYESLVSRNVIGHFDCPSVGKERELTCVTTTAAKPEMRSQTPLCPAVHPPKRLRMESHSGTDQVDGPWTAPLRYLFQKVMSVSDVGELGRIVVPKKDAEGQLPRIDTKGTQLEMKDFGFTKSWFFHYKWWVNNKSRMYVLESTGEFIKYHGLKANDSFIVYKDACGNFVARAQKKLTWSPQLDPTVGHSEPGSSNIKEENSSILPTSTEDDPRHCVHSTTRLSASALD